MQVYDKEPQGRKSKITGETYYLHQALHESKKKEHASGYVDPYEEFRNRAHEYRPEEIEGFERSAQKLAHDQSSRPTYSRPSRKHVTFDDDADDNTIGINSGPFAGLTQKMEHLIHPHNAVREIMAFLGPLQNREISSIHLRTELEALGAFFLRVSTEGLHKEEEIYTMMKDPPAVSKPIEDESFDLDEGTLEALIQERLRFSIRKTPRFQFQFYFV